MSKKNWIGNSKSIYTTLGASSHSLTDREENDYYATPLEATRMLLDLENFVNVLEPACGEGHISKVLLEHSIDTCSYDLINRGYGQQKDFFSLTEWNGDIVTNPPYKYGKEFVEHSLKIIPTGNKVAMFLKLQFLEGKSRKKLFLENPPKTIYVSSSRLACGKNGIWDSKTSSAVAYAWFIWVKGFKEDTIIKWFN